MQDMLSLISLFLFTFFASHVLACFWIFLGRYDKDSHFRYNPDNYDLSWVYNPYNNFDSEDFTSLYINSLFWIF